MHPWNCTECGNQYLSADHVCVEIETIRPTEREMREAAKAAVKHSGLTVDQIRKEAKNGRRFSSLDARIAWLVLCATGYQEADLT